MSNKSPGRYESSLGGLIGAMIVMVALVLVFVGYRELFRDNPEVKPTHVKEWRELADSAHADGHPIAVPDVPEDWLVTTIRFEPTMNPTWQISMLTDDEKFAGVYQVDERLDTVVEERIDEKAEEGDPVTITGGDLAGEWRTFSDDGGDYALIREDRSGIVMVYGTASKQELTDLTNTLRTRPEGASAPVESEDAESEGAEEAPAS